MLLGAVKEKTVVSENACEPLLENLELVMFKQSLALFNGTVKLFRPIWFIVL